MEGYEKCGMDDYADGGENYLTYKTADIKAAFENQRHKAYAKREEKEENIGNSSKNTVYRSA